MYTYSSTVLLTRFARINFINSLFRCFVPYTGYTYVYTSSQLAWWRTVSLGTAAAVYSYIRTAVLYCFFFVSAIATLIVVVCHVLFVTTVWISENELRESINIIIMMLISAHVLVVLPTDVPHRSPSYA